MKKAITLLLSTLALPCITPNTFAKNDKVEGTIGTDIVSQYIWRGQDLSNVSIQPTLGIGYKGLSLTAWGSVGLTSAQDTKEIDLTLNYAVGGFNIGITDYWTSDGLDPHGRYFKYNAHSTNHVFEGNIGYDFDFLSVQWYTNFAGNDGVNNSGKRAYSSYLELTAPFRLAKLDWEASVGATPYATSYYAARGFAVTNVGLKATKTLAPKGKVSFPVFATITANPRTQRAYFTCGFAVQPRLKH